MTQTLFRNFRMLDPERDELVGGCEILVEGETICEVSERPIRASDAAVVDCGGRTLMPGLIDCHAHVILSEVFIFNTSLFLERQTFRQAANSDACTRRPWRDSTVATPVPNSARRSSPAPTAGAFSYLTLAASRKIRRSSVRLTRGARPF